MKNAALEHSKAHFLVDEVDYVPNAVVIKSILYKRTGSVRISSFDQGEILARKTSHFETIIYVIDGTAEVLIDSRSTLLSVGHLMIIPGHSSAKVIANERFKILSIVIKSGYEDVSL